MLDTHTCVSFAAGLKDLIDCGDNGTLEQRSVLQAIALGLLKILVQPAVTIVEEL